MTKLNSELTYKIIRNQLQQNLTSWCISSQEGLSHDKNRKFIPWFSYPAIDFLNQFLRQKQMSVFEFGCGSSTIYFSNLAEKTFSIETSRKWFEVICKKVNINSNQVEFSSCLKIIPAEEHLPSSLCGVFGTSNPAKSNLSEENFNSSSVQNSSRIDMGSGKNSPFTIVDKKFSSLRNEIFLLEDGLINQQYQAFPVSLGQKFDIILIDSIKRFECIKSTFNLLKPGGILILDDSQRSSYRKIFEFLTEKNFHYQNFVGIAPGQLNLKSTTIFYKNEQS